MQTQTSGAGSVEMLGSMRDSFKSPRLLLDTWHLLIVKGGSGDNFQLTISCGKSTLSVPLWMVKGKGGPLAAGRN